MSAPETWTADRLAGWVREKFGGYAASHQAWCDTYRARGFMIAAYGHPSGCALLIWVPDGCEADDVLPFTDGTDVWPLQLAGVCHPEGSNVVPLPLAAGSGR